MFGEQKYNHQGVYYVKLFDGNMWKEVLIDDYIPVTMAKDKRNESAYTPTFTYNGLTRKSNDPL